MLNYNLPPELASLRRLTAFIEVGECLSYSKAATRLGISQPAVSNHIRKLEALSGTELFRRNGHSIMLTEAGHALLRQAKRVEASVREMQELIVTLQREVAGHLIIGASAIWEYVLPEVMARFQRVYPRVSMELVVGNSGRIIELMIQRRMHLGFTGDEGGQSDLDAVPIMENEMVVVAPPGHPLVGRPLVAPSELAGQPLVLREANSATARIAAHYLDTLGVTPGSVVEFGSHEALKAAVRAGFGLGMVFKAAVQQELAAGSLGLVHLQAPPCIRQLYMLRSRFGAEASVRKAFFDYVATYLTPQGWRSGGVP